MWHIPGSPPTLPSWNVWSRRVVLKINAVGVSFVHDAVYHKSPIDELVEQHEITRFNFLLQWSNSIRDNHMCATSILERPNVCAVIDQSRMNGVVSAMSRKWKSRLNRKWRKTKTAWSKGRLTKCYLARRTTSTPWICPEINRSEGWQKQFKCKLRCLENVC